MFFKFIHLFRGYIYAYLIYINLFVCLLFCFYICFFFFFYLLNFLFCELFIIMSDMDIRQRCFFLYICISALTLYFSKFFKFLILVIVYTFTRATYTHQAIFFSQKRIVSFKVVFAQINWTEKDNIAGKS